VQQSNFGEFSRAVKHCFTGILTNWFTAAALSLPSSYGLRISPRIITPLLRLIAIFLNRRKSITISVTSATQ